MSAGGADYAQELGLGYTLFRNLLRGDFSFNDDGER